MDRQQRAAAFAVKNARRRAEVDLRQRKINKIQGQRLSLRILDKEKFRTIYPVIQGSRFRKDFKTRERLVSK